MTRTMVAAVIALLASSLMLPHQELLARECGGSGSGSSGYPSSRAGMRGWIGLHRPDGEVIRIKTDQIVYVMSAASTGADKRALSRIQLLNGFADVRENVDEVMLAIKNEDLLNAT
jgi:hypothetical protein